MSRLTGGLLICHSPLRWVMLVLLSNCLCVICLFLSYFYVGVGFDSPASLACWYTPVSDDTVFDGLVGMSGGHCTHPTGGPAIRLKHKKKP